MCSLEKHKNIFILRMTGDGEHRFNPEFMDSIISAIAYVNQNAHQASAIIVTNDGKYFSNGLDLEWMSHDKEIRTRAVGDKFVELLAAVMGLKLPSIAAVCGHACAAGFIFALAHDYRFMRNDRGFLYMSEVDVGIIIPPSVMSVIRSKVDSRHLTEVMLGGLKYGAQEALGKGLVDSTHGSSDETLGTAINAAVELGKRKWKGEVYLGLRLGAFPEAAEKLGIRSVSVLASRL
ncbi:enoyl-CoA delta isomerase 2, peroxisomal [Cryptomeria japonica]|uniref:enoyl-CoA delta isomerase 2, peroxisomal n=1 Tax=Cryptomeria japonica TaxID=3369 RepID=UPI0027DA2C4B|nr:enoyl-CoA delta isomerase 2, peroxisomal [Cryptomeria japonica]